MTIVQEVQQKIDAISKPKGISCRPVLVHASDVTQDVKDSDYFAEIIDFTKAIEG